MKLSLSLILSLCLSLAALADQTITIKPGETVHIVSPTTQGAPLPSTQPATEPTTKPATQPMTKPSGPKYLYHVTNGQNLVIENKVIVQGRDDCAVEMKGGTLTMRNVVLTDGGIANIQGGESATFIDVSSTGAPSKDRSKPGSYLLISSTKLLKSLTWINTKGQILKEGDSESCIRIMDCKQTYLKGLVVQSSNNKPDIVIRSDDLEGKGGDGTATIEDCDLKTMEVGAQKVDANYIDQRLGKVMIRNTKIRGGTVAHPVIRSPGVKKLNYQNVVVSDGTVTK